MTIDLDHVRNCLTGWFVARLPRASDIVLSDLSTPGAGASNETYFLSVEYKENGKEIIERFVIRWPPSGFLVFPSESYNMTKQYDLLKRLSGAGARTPKVFGLEEDSSVIGRPFFIMERIDGWVPGDFPPYHVGGLLFDMREADRAQVWRNGVEALAELHQIDWRSAGLEILGAAEPDNFVDEQIALWDGVHGLNKGPLPPVLASSRQWLLNNRFSPEHLCLCWGDARLGNMVYQDVEVAALLDWEMALIGDPIADLAWFLHVDWASSVGKPSAPTPRLTGLPDADQTRKIYQTLTGWSMENFDYYDVLAAYRLAIVYTRIEQDERYLARSGNKKGVLTSTHFEKLTDLIGL